MKDKNVNTLQTWLTPKGLPDELDKYAPITVIKREFISTPNTEQQAKAINTLLSSKTPKKNKP